MKNECNTQTGISKTMVCSYNTISNQGKSKMKNPISIFFCQISKSWKTWFLVLARMWTMWHRNTCSPSWAWGQQKTTLRPLIHPLSTEDQRINCEQERTVRTTEEPVPRAPGGTQRTSLQHGSYTTNLETTQLSLKECMNELRCVYKRNTRFPNFWASDLGTLPSCLKTPVS